ncbi:MAG TPA: phospho-N-acetylmuramoyl-pentapeptide-transferase [Verrucomicrobiales bacterium]|nr:phospho-N-acetylmuramoyl-pentapeptide-transferase [Verrucomicrobiales bacterium]
MIYWIYQLLEEQYESLVRVFSYVSSRAFGAALTAFLLTVVSGNFVIRKLFLLKIGQPIREAVEVHQLHELHGKKEGTPTMGGLLILGAVIVSTLLWARWDNGFVWLCLGVTLYLGILGFVDDFTKVRARKSAGISAWMKIGAQAILAVGVTSYLMLVRHPDAVEEGMMSRLYLPFVSVEVSHLHMQLGLLVVFLFAGVIVGCSNAVNLTDGLDGLAIGCTITTAATFALLNYVAGRPDYSSYLFIPHHPWANEITIFCLAIAGAGLGFLWFNCYPARVFMGDTGSLAIGGMLGAAAICCKQELLLIIVGGVFVIEAVSVILQVGSFKLTGRRIFRMSPIHHHFELKGWPETRVIVRFWILSMICAGIGLASLKLR